MTREGHPVSGIDRKLQGRRPFGSMASQWEQALIPVIRAARASGYSGPTVISTTTETGKDMAIRLGERSF